jgi:OOP family OmpA-OmpF porin
MNAAKLIPLVLLTLSTGALADNDLYVVGEVTHSRDTLKTSTFDSQLTPPVTSNGKSNGNQWRLQLGYKVNPNFAVEAGYIDFGKAKYSATYGVSGGTAQGTVKAGGFDIAALGILPVADNFSVFGKAGIVAARVKSSLTDATASGEVSSNVISPLIGLGASYKVSDNMDVRAEYDHVSNLGKTSTTGKMSANMLSVGVAYHF